MMNRYGEFFAWCQIQGLKSDRMIAAAFGMTAQTVRNWRARARAEEAGQSTTPPRYLALACKGYETARKHSGDVVPAFPEMEIETFDSWRAQHGLNTLELTGEAFGLTRQAIHNWFKRKSLPRWLPLACLGYEQRENPAIEAA